jgi:lysophospholipase L1-like esterase
VKRTLALLATALVVMAFAPSVSAGSAAPIRLVRPAAHHATATPNLPPPLPDSIAVMGDSISQAFDSECCAEQPQHSWATGDDPNDGIQSQYERILAANPAIAGRNHNDAVTGARMADAPAQAARAVAQQAQYVVIEMGGNDLCSRSPSSMTPVALFRSQLHSTLRTLAAGLPAGAHVFVASIPNVYRLWQILHNDAQAELVWQVAGICQSMLAIDNTEADRQAVVAREQAFDSVLRKECGRFAFCRYDKGAIYGFQFGPDDVNHIDYFHPSIQGQAAFAALTWPKSWWPGT